MQPVEHIQGVHRCREPCTHHGFGTAGNFQCPTATTALRDRRYGRTAHRHRRYGIQQGPGRRNRTGFSGSLRRRTGYRKVHAPAPDHPTDAPGKHPLRQRRRKRAANQAPCRPHAPTARSRTRAPALLRKQHRQGIGICRHTEAQAPGHRRWLRKWWNRRPAASPKSANVPACC